MTLVIFWILATFLSSCVMSFYSMQEMACISYNRLRLEFAVRSGQRRAKWIKQLLDTPTVLFGTTLVGVNLFLVISSESMRNLFEQLGLNPNLSPLIEAPYMIVFGELVPMFAARLFPEHMARLGAPFLWASSKVLAPITLLIDSIFRRLRRLFLSEEQLASPPHLQRDELRELIEEKKPSYFDEANEQLESIVSRIFSFSDKEVRQFLIPLEQAFFLNSSQLCGQARIQLSKRDEDFALVRNRQNRILGTVELITILNAPASASIGSFVRPPTYVGEATGATELLFRLKKEHAECSLVVDSKGEVIGLVTLDDLLTLLTRSQGRPTYHAHIYKTVSADVNVEAFLHKHRITIPSIPARTFGQLIETLQGRKPSLHDTVSYGPLEMKVLEVGIRGAKIIQIKTL